MLVDKEAVPSHKPRKSYLSNEQLSHLMILKFLLSLLLLPGDHNNNKSETFLLKSIIEGHYYVKYQYIFVIIWSHFGKESKFWFIYSADQKCFYFLSNVQDVCQMFIIIFNE